MFRKAHSQYFALLTLLLAAMLQIARADTIFVTYSGTNTNSGAIAEYDAVTGAAINTALVTGLNSPVGVAIDGSGNLYAANNDRDTVGKYNASTGAAINTALVTGINGNATGVVLDGSGHLYVASYYGDSIGEYNASTGAAINTALVTGLNSPIYMALDGSGHLYVSNYDGASVGEYNASTGAAINPSLVTGITNPVGLAVDGSGHLYVVSLAGSSIGEYNASTGAAINPSLVTGLNGPFGLALGNSNNLYVADNDSNSIGEYNASTGAVINAALVTNIDVGANQLGPFGLAFRHSASSAVSWTGVKNGVWDTSTANWATSGSTATYSDGNAVTFNDKNALTSANVSNTNVMISGSVSPQSVTFNNTGAANGGVDYTISGGAIAGSGALTKNGAGTVTLTGANTYTGTTTINAGMFAAGASNRLSPNSAVTVSGGTLDASGFANTVASLNITSGGLNLGLSNTLTCNGTAILNGAINVKINGADNGQPALVAGSASLGGSLGVTLASGFTPTSGDPFQILSATSLTGSFGNSGRLVQATSSSNGSSIGQFTVAYHNNSAALIYQPLLMLATLSNNVYSGNGGYGSYAFLMSSPIDPNNLGFRANAYVSPDGSQVVVAVRGTYLDNSVAGLKNIAADVSFAGIVPSALLVSEITDAAGFVKSVETAYPSANITLTGHSLGGVVAQLVGEASGLDTYAFDAPGARQLYGALSTTLSVGSWGSPVVGRINTDYRMYGDQVSLFGTPIGNTVTIMNPTQPTLLSVMNLNYIKGAHNLENLIDQIPDNLNNLQVSSGSPGQSPELNVAQPLQAMLTGTQIGAGLYSFVFSVTNGEAKVIDPTGGTDFTFTENTGSPNLASVTLPVLDGVASYDLRYLQNGAWSNMQYFEPGVEYDLPAGVTGVDFTALDSLGNGVTLSDFLFQEGFSSTGTVSATLTESTVPEPSTLVLLAAGALGLLGYGLRRRRIARTAKPAAFDRQDDGPATLPFPSRVSRTEAIRWAA